MSKQVSLAIVRVLTLGVMASSVGLGCDARWHRIGEGLPPPPSGGEAGPGAPGGSPGAGGVSGAGGALGTAGAPVPARPLPVTARQAVTRMARLLWQSAPDATLLSSADSGALATSEDVRQLALRMVQDPRARAGLGGFYRWWLDLERLPLVQKDPLLFPQYNADLVRDMALETETFAVSVTLDSPGTFNALLVAPYSYLNERLAQVYGVSGVSGPDLRMTLLDPTQRAGLLTQPSFLTLGAYQTMSSPTSRGGFISSKLRCMTLPPPPPDTIPAVDPPQPGLTTRQRFEQHRSSAACAACHVNLDGVGFAYEHYDAIGQYRTVDNGLPIDASTQLPGSPAVIEDAIDMAGALADDPQAQKCMPRQWLTYGLGRDLTTNDEATATDAYRRFVDSGFVLRQLIAGVVQTDAFLTAPPICTPGADQTCNDNPALSSIRGQCTAAARCLCPNSLVNPETGRCL
jgi:hypothetical protein